MKWVLYSLFSLMIRGWLYPSLNLAIETLIDAQPSRHFKTLLQEVNNSLVFRPKLGETLVAQYLCTIASVQQAPDVFMFLYYDQLVKNKHARYDNLHEQILLDWESVLEIFGPTIRNLYALERFACDNNDENYYDYEADFTSPICSLHLSVLKVLLSGLHSYSERHVAHRVAQAIDEYYLLRQGTPLPARIAQILASESHK